MKREYTGWGVSYKFVAGDRRLLGWGCFGTEIPRAIPVAVFPTRREARGAQAVCCFRPTRVERVVVTVEATTETTEKSKPPYTTLQP